MTYDFRRRRAPAAALQGNVTSFSTRADWQAHAACLAGSALWRTGLEPHVGPILREEPGLLFGRETKLPEQRRLKEYIEALGRPEDELVIRSRRIVGAGSSA